MGKFYSEIPDSIIPWVRKQELFWVATAPLSGDGHINLSPKGLAGTFHIVDSHTVWYEDCIVFGQKESRPSPIYGRTGGSQCYSVRSKDRPGLSGYLGKVSFPRPSIKDQTRTTTPPPPTTTGTVHEFGTPEYEQLLPLNVRKPGSRAAILVDVHKVGTSCGYAVPFFHFRGHRTQLVQHFHAKELFDSAPDAPPDPHLTAPMKSMKGYWWDRNSTSIDGLPGILQAFNSPINFRREDALYEKDDITIKMQTPHKTFTRWMMMHLDIQSFLSFLAGILVSCLYFKFGECCLRG